MSKPKLYLHVFVPASAVFILNNVHLLTLETPGYLILNVLSFGVVITLSILCLRNFGEKETRHASTIPIKSALHDITGDAETIGEAYSDLKQLLIMSCQKNSLPIAKELARICSELGPAAADLNEKVEDRLAPRERTFKQGSLRNVYKTQKLTPVI